VQCDIDILGEPTVRAEAELLTASLDALDALGLEGAFIRVNDRRLLLGMLRSLGFAPAEFDGVLITVDKLDKIGQEGVVAELRERGVTPAAVDALDAFFHRPQTREFLPFGEAAIRTALPESPDETALADLVALGEAVSAARSLDPGAVVLRFDPFLVRGMGYYTGPIFELAHPSVPYSLGGGGRYDGMIGRFLGADVPATGFSLGFERLVELVNLPAAAGDDAIALLHDADVPLTNLLTLKTELIATGARARLVQRPKNVKPALDALAIDGFTSFAFVDSSTTLASLSLRSLA